MDKPTKPNKSAKPEAPKEAGKAPVAKESATEKEVLLVADRQGQRISEVYDGRGKSHVRRPVTVEAGETFKLVCPINDKGVVKVPRWAHIPDADELKAIEARNLAAHKKAGDARAI